MVKNKPVLILDIDIGTNPDDFFSLLMLLKSDNIDVKLTLTGNRFPYERALMAKKIIELMGRDIEVIPGEETGCVDFFAQDVIKDIKFDFDNDYIKKMKEIIDENKEVIYLGLQGLSNLSKFIKKYPSYKDKDKINIIHMGANLKGANDKFISGGTNMEADSLAAKYIYETCDNLVIVGAHTTINDKIRISPDTEIYKNLERSNLPEHKLLFNHLLDFHKRRHLWPAMHDPLTTSVALGEKFVKFKKVKILFDKRGQYALDKKGKEIKVSEDKFDESAFMNYLHKSLFSNE